MNTGLGLRRLKSDTLALLERDLSRGIDSLVSMAPGHAVHILFSAICRNERPLRWHAVTAMGRVVAGLAGRDIEAARVVLRRLIWSLNDESGGIGWGAPEAMAETLAMHRTLMDEYGNIFVSYMSDHAGVCEKQGNSYIEHPLLQRGLLWGVGRLAFVCPVTVATRAMTLLPVYLDAEDLTVRALAARALGLFRAGAARQQIAALLKENGKVELYENHTVMYLTAAEIARRSLMQIDATGEVR